MKVIGVDQTTGTHALTVDVAGQQVSVDIPLVTLDEALAAADAMSLHIPAQADGQAVIDAEAIAKMKPGALLLNAARGGVVDEDAMLEALD